MLTLRLFAIFKDFYVDFYVSHAPFSTTLIKQNAYHTKKQQQSSMHTSETIIGQFKEYTLMVSVTSTFLHYKWDTNDIYVC